MSAAHLPCLDAHLLSALQTREHSQTVLVVAVELQRIVLRRLVGVARDVHIIIIVEARDIPVVHLDVLHILSRIIARRETVVHDVASLVIREDEVARGFEEVLFVRVALMTLVVVVGIHVAATLILTDIYQIHLHNAIDGTVMFFLHHLLIVLVVSVLAELNLHGVARGYADHVLRRTVVALLELAQRVGSVLLVLILMIVVDVFLLHVLIRGRGKLSLTVVPLVITETDVGRNGAHIMDIVGESHVVACLGVVHERLVVVSLSLQVAVGVHTDAVSHHLYLAHTRDGVGRLVYLVDGIVACTEQREAVVLQADDVQTLEGVQNLRIVDGVFGKAISRNVGAAEALRIREVTVAEDASLAVILVEDVLTDAVKSGGRRTATFIEILVLQRYVAIRIDVLGKSLVVVVMLIVIAIEVCAFRHLHRLHLLT